MVSGTQQRLLQRMQVPRLYWDASWDEVPDSAHKAVAQRFVSDTAMFIDRGEGLLFWGPDSQGKTALATLCLRDLAERAKIGLFVVASRIPQMIIERTRFDGDETMYDRMHSVPLLVVDELFVREKETFADAAIERVFRERLGDLKATIFTTNMSPDELSKAFPSLYAAMREAVLPVKVVGRDFRGEKMVQLKERWRGLIG